MALIYKLISANTTKVSYIMGTMHVSDKRAFAFVPLASKLIAECSSYIGEMDLSYIDQSLVKQAFTLQDDEKYSAYFSPKNFRKNRKIILKSFGIDLLQYDDTAPIFLQSLIAATVLCNDNAYSLDQHLMQMALAANLVVSGLESQEEQYQIAKSLDINVQMKQFSDLCRQPSSFRKQINHLCLLYSKGNDRQLYLSSKKGLGSFRSILLYDRNKIMAQRIIDAIHQTSTFISVGAGHLQGNKGIMAYLKKHHVKCIKIIEEDNFILAQKCKKF